MHPRFEVSDHCCIQKSAASNQREQQTHSRLVSLGLLRGFTACRALRHVNDAESRIVVEGRMVDTEDCVDCQEICHKLGRFDIGAVLAWNRNY